MDISYDTEARMEYRKSILIIMASDVDATTDWGILEESFEIVKANGENEAKEYFQSEQKK